MTPTQVVELVFRDGVSTAEDVTDVSGRGVGMSAVKAEVQRLGGHIAITTELGKGTRVELIVPRASRAGAPGRTPSRSDKLGARPRDPAASVEGLAIGEDGARPLRPSAPPPH
jgi:hypothetical protein